MISSQRVSSVKSLQEFTDWLDDHLVNLDMIGKGDAVENLLNDRRKLASQ